MAYAHLFDGGRVSLSISEQQVRDVVEELGSEERGQAAVRAAINDTLRWARTMLVRKLRDVLNLPAAEIRSRIALAQMATDDNLVGVLRVSYDRVPLEDFKARFRRKSGVTVTTIKPDGPETFKHMFRAKMVTSGHTGVFERNQYEPKHIPRNGRYAGRLLTRGPRKGQPIKRQSIAERVGPSVMGTLEKSPGLLDAALAEMGAKFEERLASKLSWQRASAGSGGGDSQPAEAA